MIMVTELTPNLMLLLKSNDYRDNDLALMLMGYNETKEDYNKLVALLNKNRFLVTSTGTKKRKHLISLIVILRV
jgi:hypothetical protein